MNSSGKFFVPMMTFVPADWAGRAKTAANKPMTIATPREIANAALAARFCACESLQLPSLRFANDTSTAYARRCHGDLNSS